MYNYKIVKTVKLLDMIPSAKLGKVVRRFYNQFGGEILEWEYCHELIFQSDRTNTYESYIVDSNCHPQNDLYVDLSRVELLLLRDQNGESIVRARINY